MTEAGGGREELRPHLRREAISDDTIVIVRGGPDDLASLARHARRMARAFALDGRPLWGVSVLAALDDIGSASLIGILSGRLATYAFVHLPSAGGLAAAGFELLPSFGRPHFTVRLESDNQEHLEQVLAALGPAQANPYHGGRQPRRR